MLITDPPPDAMIAGMPNRHPRKCQTDRDVSHARNSSIGASTTSLSAGVAPKLAGYQ
jgi:hypothetical protein